MNAAFCRYLVMVALSCLFLFPEFASAEGSLSLQANFLSELVGDRARLIQVSLVVVALGCALLWWSK